LDPDDGSQMVGSQMVGPNLGSIGSELDRETLLEAMIDPSARLSPGFGTVNITLKDGETLVGVLEQETEDLLSIRTSSGSTRAVSQDQIEKKQYLPSSMPAMHTVLTREEIRDLVAFLIGRQN
jgi:quinoprotein glucose dehydrogenase